MKKAARRRSLRATKRCGDRYASDEDALAATVAAILEARGLPAARPAEPAPPRVTRVKVEAQHVEQFRVSVPGQDIEATRREQSLVLAYVEHLESHGHKVSRGKYQPGGSDSVLASDLVDETDGVLYEAKGRVRRASVRMAIGQLLDYRRFEPRQALPVDASQLSIDAVG